MIVAALTLDGLDQDGRRVVAAADENFPNLAFRALLAGDDIFLALRFGQREVDARRQDTRPGEFGEVVGLTRIRTGQAQGVTAATVEGAFEVQNARSALAPTRREVP